MLLQFQFLLFSLIEDRSYKCGTNNLTLVRLYEGVTGKLRAVVPAARGVARFPGSRVIRSRASLSRCTHKTWQSLRAVAGSVFSVGRSIYFPRSRVRQEVGLGNYRGFKGSAFGFDGQLRGNSKRLEHSRERGSPLLRV